MVGSGLRCGGGLRNRTAKPGLRHPAAVACHHATDGKGGIEDGVFVVPQRLARGVHDGRRGRHGDSGKEQCAGENLLEVHEFLHCLCTYDIWSAAALADFGK
jgi:hypothetical protein